MCVIKLTVSAVSWRYMNVYIKCSVHIPMMCVIKHSDIQIFRRYINLHILVGYHIALICVIKHLVKRVIWEYINLYILGCVRIPVICVIKHKTFFDRSNLKVHQRLHNVEGRWPSYVCNKTVSLKCVPMRCLHSHRHQDPESFDMWKYFIMVHCIQNHHSLQMLYVSFSREFQKFFLLCIDLISCLVSFIHIMYWKYILEDFVYLCTSGDFKWWIVYAQTEYF